MTLRRNAHRSLIRCDDLHTINTDVADAGLRVAAYIKMPCPDVSASVNLAPPRHRKNCEIDSLSDAVIRNSRFLDEDWVDRILEGSSGRFDQIPELDSPVLNSEGQRDRRVAGKSISKQAAFWIIFNVFEKQRCLVLAAYGSDFELPVHLFVYALKLAAFIESSNKVAQRCHIFLLTF